MRSTTQTRTSRVDQSRPTKQLTIRPVGEIEHPLSVVIYGRSGTGKTTLASTFPKPMLFLDVKDQGTASISDVKGIGVVQVDESGDLDIAYGMLKSDKNKYKTVVIDTVSQLQQIVVSEVARENNKEGTGNWGTLTKRDWGTIASRMKDLLVDFRDLSADGINVVFIAQDRTFNIDDDSDERMELAPEIGPGLSPSIAKTLNAAVQMIGNTFIRVKRVESEVKGKKVVHERLQHCLRIGPSPVYITKVRKPKTIEAPSIIVNPTYEALIQLIQGE